MAIMRSCFCVVLLLGVRADVAKVTPMEKVITLLKSLSSKVTAEGAKEAAQYDKYACFCKEQADEKLYAIEKSTEKISSLKAQISMLDTAIADLNSDIGDLSKKVTNLEGEITEITDTRSKEHDEYSAKAKDMNEAISSCGAAIDALKDSKKSMKGAKLDFAQVQKAHAVASGAVALLSKLSGGAAPKFEYQSNDIIATLEGLQATFKDMKKNLDIQEHDINSAFESKKLGLSNEKTFAEKERGEKEAVVEAKTEELEGAKNSRDEEQKDMDSDDAFLKEVTKDCEATALLFDSRSKTRADELTALSEATAELEKGAVPNFSANKKLTGLQKTAIVTKAAISPVVTKAAISPVSFVQTSNDKTDHKKELVLQKVLDSLHKAAARTGSNVLANVVMRAKMSEDHFVKVRLLIKDLISKLKADALSEATQKKTCDTGMKKAIADRDEANAKIEMADAKITSFTAKAQNLKSEINTLTKDIAAIKKEILEATELRSEDKADNLKTTTMSEEAIDSVKMALGLLQDFYNKAMLAQTGKYTPPKADRSGNTVGDLAPEVFDKSYHGSQSESKGIVGILEVILSDFERTKSTAEDSETESQEAFESLEKDATDSIAEKEGSIEKKDGELSDTESDIIDQQQALSDAKDLLSSGQNTLEGLQAMCVKGEETWEERKKKREEEIAALKDALAIFEDWQKE